ncbi:hypothetical protein QQP08_023452 [Theobroma cacao]|nr:hypothetical protein QQP08_023452 [Theobroma cacao]
MKVHGIWVFFFVVWSALLVFTFSSSSSIPVVFITAHSCQFLSRLLNVIPGMEFSQLGNGVTITGTSRKLKGNGYNLINEKKTNVDLEDYHPIDPVPSSKASIKPGPIEHGSPLIPFIPKPSPPAHPISGGST